MERGCVATLPPVSVDQGLRREYNWSRSSTNTVYSYTTEQRSAVVWKLLSSVTVDQDLRREYNWSRRMKRGCVSTLSSVTVDQGLPPEYHWPRSSTSTVYSVYPASTIGQDPPLVRCTRKAQKNEARLCVNTIIRHC
ncbi:hypothetical protein J6590_061050 [Homalodisca vitripennis]|nr:hypothetical protein J6590_061050 [Homalodisca vitripennis]